MSVQGKGTKSIRLKRQSTDKFKTIEKSKVIRFAHQATAGDITIDLTSLSLPTGITSPNPSSIELQRANLLTNKDKLTLISDSKGVLILERDYKLTTSTTIQFTDEFGVAATDEQFYGIISPISVSDAHVVDANFIAETGEISSGNTDISIGKSFRVNQNSTEQVGDVYVFLDGQLLLRNVGNATAAPAADGDYQEVDSGDGTSVLIRLNVAVPSDSVFSVVSTSAFTFRSDGVLDEIEKINATQNLLVDTVAALAGVPTTNFDASPTRTQLSQFGGRLVDLESGDITIDGEKTYSEKQTFSGGFSLDPANMSDADATMLGLKKYGISDTSVTLNSAGTIDFFEMIPYKLKDGSWRLKVNATGSTVSLVTSLNLIIAGTTFANFTGSEVGEGHAATVYGFESGVSDKSFIAIARKNQNFIRISTTEGGSLNRWSLAGDLPLQAKPTWAI